MKKPKASDKTLRVGNISDETSPKDLRKSFSEYGPVSTVHIHSENPNKVSASLVMFWDDAEDALDNQHGVNCRGRWLTVEDEALCWDDE